MNATSPALAVSRAAPQVGARAARRLGAGVFAIAQAETRKLRRSPMTVVARSFQPLLWLLVFGAVLGGDRLLAVGAGDYRAYLAPAVLAQVGATVALLSGLGLIWERDAGQLQRLLATSLPRAAVVLGKATGACVQALAQALVLVAVLVIAAIPLRWSLPGVLVSLAMLALGTAAFASMSILIAAIFHDRDRFMGTAQMVMLPMFFVSSALYPLALMPAWLRIVAQANPLTYEIQGMRRALVGGGPGAIWLDFTVVFVFFVAMLIAATRLYPRAAR